MLLLSAIAGIPARAQDAASADARDSADSAASRSHRLRSWIATGPGAASNLRSVGGVGGSIEWALQMDTYVVMVRGGGGAAVSLASDASNEGVGDYGVLFGRVTSRKGSHALVAAGFGRMVGGCGASFAPCPDIFSVPVVAEGAVHFGPVFALGGQVFANLNRRSPMFGTALVLQFGWFGRR